jgi:hypothetical protein
MMDGPYPKTRSNMKINSEKLNSIPASTYKWKVHNGKIEIISLNSTIENSLFENISGGKNDGRTV